MGENMQNNLDLKKLLKFIDPSSLDYQEWVNVGMALKHEGYTADIWDQWSSTDSRYIDGECYKKWCSFNEMAGVIVTGGTIVKMAQERGWKSAPIETRELDWDDVISYESDEYHIVDKNWLEKTDIREPKNWNPVNELITYIETLFDSTENVGYVTRAWQKEKDGKYLPTKGASDRTAGQLIQELYKCNGDLGAVLGDYKEEVGAWIRFNPLDGKGIKNSNVTDFRYALVESDTLDIESQHAIIKELELPVATLVHSGKKSLHAIVKIEANSYEEYRKRVDYLYRICKKNGLDVDTQNRNPSRLSRMPGVIRNGKKQYLLDTNIGKASWDEWHEWIEGVNDDLPEPENLDSYFDDLPDLAPPLIENLLRQGHKLLMAGPSKAGKSYALIELCIAIAEGKKWINWDCAKGKVMYVNLELDRASCLHRFKDVYTTLGYKPDNLKNIDIWNLRGKAVPMDKLAPKLIRRAVKKDYIAIVIDPIYKVITGDENSADQMANFCNQFDKIANDLGCAVIYCHHHSKGSQGSKRSMDRANGSGVFARDPDALLDLIELDVTEDLQKQETNRTVAKIIADYIEKNDIDYFNENVSYDDTQSQKEMQEHAKQCLNRIQQSELESCITIQKRKIETKTAWRIEGTLREFATFKPVNCWFEYPVHKADESEVLEDLQPESEKPAWQKSKAKTKSPEDKKKERKEALETAYSALDEGEGVTASELAEYLGVSKRTVWNHIKEHGGFETIKSGVGKESRIVKK